MMSKPRAELTISAVADRTAVSPAVLRAWESRFGFPRPERLPSGHRRYSDRQVEEIDEVIRHRAGGMSLAAAVHAVMARQQQRATSMYAEVRRRFPNQPVHVLSKRAMHAISRAIEDECLAQAEGPVLIGSFQREHFYRQSERRWRELARTARSTTVFADFAVDADPGGGPREVSVPETSALRREWAVVCDSPHAAACLLGVERSDAHAGNRSGSFEAMWSVDPELVRDAAEVGTSLAQPLEHPSAIVAESLPDPYETLRRATAITNRTVAYLDA